MEGGDKVVKRCYSQRLTPVVVFSLTCWLALNKVSKINKIEHLHEKCCQSSSEIR